MNYVNLIISRKVSTETNQKIKIDKSQKFITAFEKADWSIPTRRDELLMDVGKKVGLTIEEAQNIFKSKISEELITEEVSTNDTNIEQTKTARAVRNNIGKLRYNLIPPYPMEQIAKLYTYGAKKYSPNNWKKGMPWSECVAALKRHLAAFEAVEDYDYDQDCAGCKVGDCNNHSGLFHMVSVAWNAITLIDYYRSNPQFDDRLKSYLKLPKVVLDIDEVVCGWAQGYKDFTGKDIQSSYWDSCYGFTAELDELAKNKEFWLGLPCIRKPDFVPHAYVSSRSIPVEWTQEWLQKNELPCRPVYHVPFDTSKVEVLESINTEFFIDDRFENFREAQLAGIDAKHNQFYNVGYRRIYDLKLKNIIR